MARFAHPSVHGDTAPGFEPVRVEFERNFTERGEVGAAFAAYHRGEKVVDLWGGVRDPGTGDPFERDTLIPVFSVTKGMASLAVALAHSRGLLDYEEKVATYWPEFAAAGKGAITIRQLLGHQAGLSAIDTPLDVGVISDPDRLADILAAQKPAWPPGDRHGYHTWSFGWYASELIRRVDPKRRTLGRFFQDEIAGPLDLEFYIGLPAEIPDSRIAAIQGIRPVDLIRNAHKMRRKFVLAFLNPMTLTARTMRNPGFLSRNTANMRRRDILTIEIPSGNGVGQVRSVARAYGVFAAGGSELGIRRETLHALSAPAVPPAQGAHDLVWLGEMSYALGFLKPFQGFRFGSGDSAFGFPGAGGSFAYADPEAQVGSAYVMTRFAPKALNNPRETALRAALYRCLG